MSVTREELISGMNYQTDSPLFSGETMIPADSMLEYVGEYARMPSVYGFIPVGLLGLHKITEAYLQSSEYKALATRVTAPPPGASSEEWNAYTQLFVDSRNAFSEIYLSEDQLGHLFPVTSSCI